jgi:heme ABC exporter ATP-binding subunit CcmA
MDPVVTLDRAVALVGRYPALAGVTLSVDPGERVLLQGPNGAGKTTLLRCCAGLVPIIDGRARVLGIDLRRDPRAVRRHVGLLGHGTQLYDDLTVVDNATFWGRAAGAAPDEIEAALRTVELPDRLRTVPVVRLSAGQRRRLALAVLIARRPRLWLLDEPHAGLDADGRDLIDALLRGAAAAGATVLVASHEHERAGSIAHRTVDLADGVVRDAPRPAGVRAAVGC